MAELHDLAGDLARAAAKAGERDVHDIATALSEALIPAAERHHRERLAALAGLLRSMRTSAPAKVFRTAEGGPAGSAPSGAVPYGGG